MPDDATLAELVTLLRRAGGLDAQARGHAVARRFAEAARDWRDGTAALREAAAALDLRCFEMLECAVGAGMTCGRHEDAIAALAELRGLLAAARARPGAATAERIARVGMLCCVARQWREAAGLLAEADGLFAADMPLGLRLDVLGALATAHGFLAEREAGLAVLARAIGLAGAAAADGEPRAAERLAELCNTQGSLLLEASRPADAIAALRACIDLLRAPGTDRRAPGARNLEAAALNRLGHAHAALADATAAMAAFGASVALMRELVEIDNIADLREDFETALRDYARLASGRTA
jgi:hypothetical protein